MYVSLLAEWFHVLVQLVDGSWLDMPNILNKDEVKGIVRDYNNGKTIYIKLTYPAPEHILNLFVFRSFSSIQNPTTEQIMKKSSDVTNQFNVKSSEDVIAKIRGKQKLERARKEKPKSQQKSKGVKLPKDVPITDKRIFIVHGHDDSAKDELFVLLSSMGLKPRILKEEPDEGKTIIEKLEYYSDDVGYVIVLLTPDDLGGQDKKSLKPRARQNVILELGYFMGKFGRSKILCLIRGREIEAPLEKPSDTLGIVTHTFSKKVDECSKDLYRSLISAGYKKSLK